MQRRYWILIYWLAALLFGVLGVTRLLTVGDLMAFARLTMAVGLVLAALWEENRNTGRTALLKYLPEVFIVSALLQFGYYYLGV
jgi:dolichyl-phosphate-mannose--protein O-mannosyl transferase